MYLLVLALAFTAFFIVEALRRLPPFERWTLMGKRPWACNLCMSFWTGAFVVGIAVLTKRMSYDWVAHGLVDGLCLLLLDWAGTFEPPQPFFPE